MAGAGGGWWELLLNQYGVSVLQDKELLEKDGGDGGMIARMDGCHRTVWLK